MRRFSMIYRLFFLAACCCAAGTSWGQSYDDRYSSYSIRHKDDGGEIKNKWYQWREGSSASDMDTFDDEGWEYDNPYTGNAMQATHMYVDTLYVRKGSDCLLLLPTTKGEGSHNNSTELYQRWYNFRTEGLFTTGSYNRPHLLTPNLRIGGQAFQLANGYVAGSGHENERQGQSTVVVNSSPYLIYRNSNRDNNSGVIFSANFHYPSDYEYEQWRINNGTGDRAGNNDEYIVACDLSGYTDFTESWRSNSSSSSFTNTWTEPTLALRAIFVIRGVDDDMMTTSGVANAPAWFQQGFGRLTRTEYQGGNGRNKKFLEEYDITFPADHISYHASGHDDLNSDELVALSKGGGFYGGLTLSASIVDDETSADIAITDRRLTTVSRSILFRGTNGNGNVVTQGSRWSVNDGDSATIVVTGRQGNSGPTYNIARFKVRFKKECRLLTQHQLELIDNKDASIEDKEWNLDYRTPRYLRANYQLLTSRTFDYDPAIAEGIVQRADIQEHYYPYPLDWGYSSYAFYDGSKLDDYRGWTESGGGTFGGNPYVEWGSYCITNEFMGYDDANKSLTFTEKTLGGRGEPDDRSEYFLYVDASDLPGAIVSLPFTEDLCPGTELFVSAWVKSCSADDQADPGMLFTINGVNADGTKKVLYQQSTGRIRKTAYNGGNGEDYTRDNGFGSGTNDWYQVYFSFINDDPDNANFASYEVRIDNNSSSTTGADFYLDDIEVFISRPTASVKQLEYTCLNARTPMNISLNWEQLCERLGIDEEHPDNTPRAIDFCFVDTVKYTTAVAQGTSPAEALQQSICLIGNALEGTDQPSYNQEIGTLYYVETFDQNTPYDESKSTGNVEDRDYNLAIYNEVNGNYSFYRKGTAGGEDRALSVDFYADLSPNRPYWMLILDHASETATADDFAAVLYDPCGIRTTFFVESETLLKVNGEVVDPQESFCEGQVFNFTAQVRYPTGEYDAEGQEVFQVLNGGVNFDWFFGTEDEFTTGDPNLEEALSAFREWYPEATSLDGVVPHESDEEHMSLTQSEIDLIRQTLAEGDEGGLNRRLVLCRENLDIKILHDGLDLVVKPIKTQMPPEESGLNDSLWAQICWGYIPLRLEANGQAPELHAGFNVIDYPEGLNPNIRIGLDQIRATSAQRPLRVELRGAQFTSEDAEELGVITAVSENEPDYSKIYLTASNDPQYDDLLTTEGGEFSEFSLPIGTLHALQADKWVAGSSFENYAEIYFDLSEQTLVDGREFTFNPREGYTYTFSVHFEEKQEYGGALVGSCRGTFPVTMKVVPEYMVWNGTATDNWNNDAMWQRVADKTRLNKPATDTYPDGNETTQSFVPMIFSKVIIPKDKKVELYRAGFAGTEGGAWDSDRPTHIGEPTEYIQYDLMAYDHPDDGQYPGELRTERYRVNIVDQIHFEPGAEMLHPEYLYYNKAYVDYELDGGRWSTLATPLKEVVAGDFYTKTTGTENSEYFTDITFNATDNNRFAPSFYQRAWKNSTTSVTLQNHNNLPANVAVAGNWSALYNDVADRYEAGKGFSLKVQDVPTADGKVLVRLPKADASYSYYNMNGGQGGDATDITRTAENEGKLLVNDMFVRSVEPNFNWGTVQAQPVEVTLSESANGEYFLVGNPFMAQLDVQAFLAANSSVLEQKYWMVDDGVLDVAATTGEEATWVTTTETGSRLMAPLRSFFVKKVEGVTGDVTVTFTQDMQKLSAAEEAGTATAGVLRLVASTDDGRRSAAAVAFRGNASNGYASKEDAELFLDSNLGDVPTVYTVGGTQALSINTTPEGGCIPLGVYGTADEPVALRFEGVEACPGAELYDTKEQTRTAIYDGMEVEVTTNDAGRYYILTGDGTDDSLADGREGVSVYCVKSGEIVVASVVTSLKAVKVYAADGVLVAEKRPDGATVCRVAVNPDKIYIVHVQDVEGRTVTAKLHVR